MTDPRELAQLARKIYFALRPAMQEPVEACEARGTVNEEYGRDFPKISAILAAEMPRWVPVDERLPELKEIYTNSPKKARVLVYNGYHVMEGELEETFIRRVPVWKDATGRRTAVTHWQPLPPPPREEAK